MDDEIRVGGWYTYLGRYSIAYRTRWPLGDRLKGFSAYRGSWRSTFSIPVCGAGLILCHFPLFDLRLCVDKMVKLGEISVFMVHCFFWSVWLICDGVGKNSKRTPVRLRHKIEKASVHKQRKQRKLAKKVCFFNFLLVVSLPCSFSHLFYRTRNGGQKSRRTLVFPVSSRLRIRCSMISRRRSA